MYRSLLGVNDTNQRHMALEDVHNIFKKLSGALLYIVKDKKMMQLQSKLVICTCLILDILQASDCQIAQEKALQQATVDLIRAVENLQLAQEDIQQSPYLQVNAQRLQVAHDEYVIAKTKLNKVMQSGLLSTQCKT